MFRVELCARIRHGCRIDGMRIREAADVLTAPLFLTIKPNSPGHLSTP